MVTASFPGVAATIRGINRMRVTSPTGPRGARQRGPRERWSPYARDNVAVDPTGEGVEAARGERHLIADPDSPVLTLSQCGYRGYNHIVRQPARAPRRCLAHATQAEVPLAVRTRSE